MSTIDFILIIILLLGAYSGYKKGLILELIGIFAFVLAIFGGFKLLHTGMDYVSRMYEGFGNLLPFVAFMVLFILILIVVNMVGKLLKRVIDWTPFGVLDNLAGAVIGIAKWALALSILLWVMSGLNINFPEKFTENSSVMPLISGFSTQVGNFISTIFPSFDSFINTLEELFESFTS